MVRRDHRQVDMVTRREQICNKGRLLAAAVQVPHLNVAEMHDLSSQGTSVLNHKIA